MVQAGRYYGTPFKGRQGVTQGNTISPTISNMLTEAVISHRVTLIAVEEAGKDGFGRATQ